MYKNYKVVVNTAVGRRRYLKLLLPQVLANEIVDQYDLWVNTLDKLDIAFFEKMAEKYPKLNLIWQPEGIINGIYSMAPFYGYCQDSNTIYIKLDDDVIWFDPNFFEEICRFRVANPQYFLVSPLVINNGICNYILQNEELANFTHYLSCTPYDMKDYNGYLAEDLHKWFIEKIKTKTYDQLYCGEHIIAMQRFAINAVAWFGHDFKKFNGKLEGDDEEFLTVKYPAKQNLASCFNCNTIVSHFSFSVQREYLDKTTILSEYENIIKKQGTKELCQILNETQSLLNDIEINKDTILKKSLPVNYKRVNKRLKVKSIIMNYSLAFLKVPKYHRRTFASLYISLINAKRKYIK